jgi:hypothetical protein
LKKAKWQTPVSTISPSNCTPFASSSARADATSGTRMAIPAGLAANSWPALARVEDVERHLAERELEVVLTLGLDWQSERLAVKPFRARDVLCQHGHEVDGLDVHYGFVPSGYGA